MMIDFYVPTPDGPQTVARLPLSSVPAEGTDIILTDKNGNREGFTTRKSTWHMEENVDGGGATVKVSIPVVSLGGLNQKQEVSDESGGPETVS